MSSAIRILLLTVLVAVASTRVAEAQSAREQAGQHVVKGDALKTEAEAASKAGDSEEAGRLFDLSAEEYQAAYELVPHPLMLYNLAQVYRLGGRLEEALLMYTDFLASKPTGTAADFARKYERILQRTVGNGAGDDDDDSDDDDDDTDDDDADDDDDDLDGDDDDDDSFGGSSSASEKGIPGKTLKFGGLVVALAGAVSLGFGVKFGLKARDMSTCLGSNYPAGCSGLLSPATIQSMQWTDEADELEKDTLPATKNKMFIFGGIGAAAIVGGAFIYFLGDDKVKASESRQALQLVPRLDEQSTGFALSGWF